jgi:hypothetical protein
MSRLVRGNPRFELSCDPTHGAIRAHSDQPIGSALEKGPIVTHDYERARPLLEEFLEDPEGVEIEIVRWLVEEENVRLSREDN